MKPTSKVNSIIIVMLIVVSVIIINGCASVATFYYPNYDAFTISEPDIGVVTGISLGEPIITSKIGHHSKGIEVIEPLVFHGYLGKNITISKGFYELAHSTNNEKYYNPIDKHLINNEGLGSANQIRISSTNKIDVIIKDADAAFGTVAFSTDKQLQYNLVDSIFVSKANSFQQTMIYNGKSNDILKFSYREFIDNYARDSFTAEVTYDLSESKIIGYKGFKAEIIKATNTQLDYKIISGF